MDGREADSEPLADFFVDQPFPSQYFRAGDFLGAVHAITFTSSGTR